MGATTWNGRNARYRSPDGRFIPRATVREWLDRDIRASQQRIQDASEALRRGELSIAEWQAIMRQEIKRTQLAGETLLRGGRAQMTPADFGRVGHAVKVQYRYLAGFTDDLRSGKQRTDGTLFNRARMYAAAARSSFHANQREQLAAIGYTREKNELAPAEHCATCVAETERGWVPIGSLIPIGERTCLGNDRCTMIYE